MKERGKWLDRALCALGCALLALTAALALRGSPGTPVLDPNTPAGTTQAAYPVLARFTPAVLTRAPETPVPTASPTPAPLVLKSPTGAQVIAPFTLTPCPAGTSGWFRPHTGVDFACSDGQTVTAPLEGQVEAVQDEGALGVRVTLSREDVAVTLCGLSEVTVREGQWVRTGDELGRAGTAVCPGVHLELTLNGEWADPALYLTP